MHYLAPWNEFLPDRAEIFSISDLIAAGRNNNTSWQKASKLMKEKINKALQNHQEVELTQSGIKIKDLCDPAKSRNLCTAASIILLREFKGSELFIGRGYCGNIPLDWHDRNYNDIVHTMILYDGMVIDFTSRQFFHRQGFPRILPVIAARKEWQRCEQITLQP